MTQEPSDDGWAVSTEGDLDPDLTEEAGYSSWEPAQPDHRTLLLRVLILVTLCAVLAGVILPLL
jgi:hypothetical protein